MAKDRSCSRNVPLFFPFTFYYSHCYSRLFFSLSLFSTLLFFILRKISRFYNTDGCIFPVNFNDDISCLVGKHQPVSCSSNLFTSRYNTNSFGVTLIVLFSPFSKKDKFIGAATCLNYLDWLINRSIDRPNNCTIEYQLNYLINVMLYLIFNLNTRK